jgi:hypothetical protein
MATLFNGSITTAGTVTSTPFRLQRREGFTGICCQANFVYGSNGTSVDVTLQTSFDGGSNFCDVWHATQFTTSNARRGVVLPGITATSSSADIDLTATLSAGHSIDGLLGDQIRVKVVTVAGTAYSGTNLQVDAFGANWTQLAE